MKQGNLNSTKGKIISAAWKLFYEQGYEGTTIDQIVEEANSSKGSFYYYFSGKDALLGSLSFIFDEKYTQLKPSLSNIDSSIEKLLFLNQELFKTIEATISIDLLAKLFSAQLTTRGERQLLDQNRVYYKLLREIFTYGQESGELTYEYSPTEMIKSYAIMERGIMYDWCLCNGDYPLTQLARHIMKAFLDGYRAGNN